MTTDPTPRDAWLRERIAKALNLVFLGGTVDLDEAQALLAAVLRDLDAALAAPGPDRQACRDDGCTRTASAARRPAQRSQDPGPDQGDGGNGMRDWPAPNFALLGMWNDPDKQRPATRGNLRDPRTMPPECHESCAVHAHVGEIHQEAYNAHLLLDLLRVPAPGDGSGQDDLDARVSVLTQEFANLSERLDRIEGWHSRETGPAGTVGDYCNECGHRWPCDTQRMAEGTYTDDADYPAPAREAEGER